jgi:hypothetical protein
MLSSVRTARRNSGAGKSDNYWATRGKPWSDHEVEILRRHRHRPTVDLVDLLPGRTFAAISGKRYNMHLQFRLMPWARGEDEEIRVVGKTNGITAIRRRLPHRTRIEIERRAKHLGVTVFNRCAQPPIIVGEPLADAIRQRAREDGISMRGLDRELGTGGYFTNVASQRAKSGSGPYMPAISKAIEFFEAELVTGPDGTITINWKDE